MLKNNCLYPIELKQRRHEIWRLFECVPNVQKALQWPSSRENDVDGGTPLLERNV